MDVTINIGMMPDEKKLRSKKIPLLDDMDEEEKKEEEQPESPETTTMYIGVDGIISDKPVPKMGAVANTSKPEVQMGIE